jgi:hypothetical protein
MAPTDRDDEPDVIAGHFTLTDEQRRFKAMLAEHPRLMPYWDFQKRECDIEVLRSALGAMSSGEQIIARFFAAVWAGENVLGFDLIDAARTLDEAHLAQIQRWLADPLFP